MREFFRGWKRKAGCVTLAMACVLMAGWLRSRTQADWVLLFGRVTVVSGGQKIVAAGRNQIGGVKLFFPGGRVQTVARFPDEFWFGWDATGGRGVLTDFESGISMLPYWSIVVPLTLLSAYLLLSKPRPAKRPESI